MSEPVTTSTVAPAVTTTTTAAPVATTAPSAATSPVSNTPPANILNDAGKTDTAGVSKPSLLDDAKGEVKEGEVKEGEVKKVEPKAPVVPEKYELKAPEGMVIDDAKLAAFSTVAKELGLSNEQAQKLVDFQANIVKEQDASGKAAFDKLQEDFYKETVQEFGPKLKEELVYVAKGRDMLADKEAVELLSQAGLSNNKAIIRMFAKAGRFLSEGKLVDGKAAVEAPKSDAQILYPNLPSARR